MWTTLLSRLEGLVPADVALVSITPMLEERRLVIEGVAKRKEAALCFVEAPRFEGFVEKDGTKSIFLSKGGELLVLKKGDRVEGSFYLENIEDGYLLFRDRLTNETGRVYH